MSSKLLIQLQLLFILFFNIFSIHYFQLLFIPQVCNNYEKHLRGNTYIEYADIRSAVQAYRTLHSRWYGGKQLSLQFCEVTSWNNAMCGMYKYLK